MRGWKILEEVYNYCQEWNKAKTESYNSVSEQYCGFPLKLNIITLSWN